MKQKELLDLLYSASGDVDDIKQQAQGIEARCSIMKSAIHAIIQVVINPLAFSKVTTKSTPTTPKKRKYTKQNKVARGLRKWHKARKLAGIPHPTSPDYKPGMFTIRGGKKA